MNYTGIANLWAVVATVETEVTDHRGQVWSGARQVPTFYVQALTETEASKLALDVIDPTGGLKAVHLTVAPLTGAGFSEREARTLVNDAQERAQEGIDRPFGYDANFYPNGRCQACGGGMSEDGNCVNPDCERCEVDDREYVAPEG